MAVVTVFGKNPCVQCNATYRRMDKAGIEYNKIDVTVNSSTLDFLMDELKLSSAPSVVISKEPITDGQYDNVEVIESWGGFVPSKIDALVS